MKTVIECVVEMAGKNGVCLLDVETIMKNTSLSRNKIYAKLAKHIENKDISIFRQNGLEYVSIQNIKVFGK